MPGPFDTSTKHLLETYPAAWLAYVGLPATGPVTVIDADLSTVTAEADKVLRLDEPTRWLVHVEFQASADPTLERRMLRYNALLGSRHRVPVQSVLILLRPGANHPRLDGILHQHTPDGQLYLDFRYLVIRAWEQPVDAVIAGALGTLPLAPIAAVTEDTLPAVIRRMDNRIQAEASPREAATLWAATYLLMGLRYSPEIAEQLLRRVRDMRESSTYQAILTEGRIEEAQTILLRQGRKRFGPPDAHVQATLESINNRERLEALSERLLDVSTWDELLADA
jgi:predicted transposase YdaD